MRSYRHTETGTIYHPGQIVNGQQTHARMSDDAWAALGCEPYTPPPPEPQPSEAEQTAALYLSLREDHAEAFAAFRSQFLAVVSALAQAGVSPPDPMTFRGLAATLATQTGDEWTRAGLVLRCLYDDVLMACGGYDTAYRILPNMLSDATLGA